VRRRLDAELVRRGLAASRSEGTQAIAAGRIRVGGRAVDKPSTLVAPDEPVTVEGPPRPYVSRGGEKLEGALDGFGIDPQSRLALDAGASTGGFTDCLLRRGAEAVVAVDVGYGQLSWSLRNDPRVTVMERTNVRALRSEQLPFIPDLVVADLSFISLAAAVPGLAALGGDGAEYVLLVKPQFEAGRPDVGKGGVVRDPDVWRRVLHEVLASSGRAGLGARDVMVSPLLGPAGNAEFFVHAVRGGSMEDLGADVDTAVREALSLRERTAVS
jgi:23S rRNA (cytidine1920-2'-O)/16S rRNA (cytidine1409-2'-O)-methyltransferase